MEWNIKIFHDNKHDPLIWAITRKTGFRWTYNKHNNVLHKLQSPEIQLLRGSQNDKDIRECNSIKRNIRFHMVNFFLRSKFIFKNNRTTGHSTEYPN